MRVCVREKVEKEKSIDDPGWDNGVSLYMRYG